MTACGLRYMLKCIKKRDPDMENISLTPHVFRRSVATDMINKGAPIELIAEKLGHRSISTTRSNYIALNKAVVKQAHERYVS